MRVSSVSSTRIYCARLGTCKSEQFFDRQAIHQIIRQRRKIIHAVGDRDGLRIGQRFGGFFDSGVQVPDIHIRLDDIFAVQFQQHAQHAVRRRVLGPHVENHGLFGTGRSLNRGHGAGFLAAQSEISEGPPQG